MKITKKRLSISIPNALYDEYKAKAEYCGISLNRVIFYVLRRKRPVIVPKDVLAIMLALQQDVRKLQKTQKAGDITAIIAQIDEYLEFFNKYVDRRSTR